MLKIEATTKLTPEEAIEQAKKFFGPEGYGMTIKEVAECCVQFEGGGGGVEISAVPKGKGASLDFESREWDYQVKEFISKIK